MRKIISLALIAMIMLFAFAGCGMGNTVSDVVSDAGSAVSDAASDAGNAASDVMENNTQNSTVSNGAVTDDDGIIGNENNPTSNNSVDSTSASDALI